MSLEGAKFICLDEAGKHGEIVVAKGRKFSMGYYVNCDLVLADERAKGVHCEIECDAFGRVTIRNFSPDKPILVNGSSVEIKRILLNNSKLSILDKEYLWQFPKSSSNEFEDLNSETVSTPQKQIGIPEQPPNSCPDFKLHRELPKRFTVHNFAYCIQSDEEGNITAESNDENITADKGEKTQNEIKDQEETSDKTQNNKDIIELKSVENRSVTPEPLIKNDSSKALMETPKMNLINCTNNKENNSTQKKKKQLLTLCQPSHVVITSFSPRETGIKVEKSFTAIIKPKVQVTKPPTTPRSVYSTPQSEMDIDDDGDEKELMQFHTPSTSKKLTGTAAKVLKNSSMHLVDLTTPHKLRPGSPFLKSALKASTKKNLTETNETSSAKLAVDEQLGLSALPSTPVVCGGNSGLETPSSVISVSSTDTSSVVEITSDGSELGITPSSTAGLTTPLKSQARAGACTPKRTPQSLMKRALLTSAKKHVTTPQRGTTTPRRESINRIPLRSNLALLGSPVTPKADKNESQLPRRQSMSTPTRKSLSARHRFDNSPTTSNFAASSPSSSRRSSINPISAARALPTSTPLASSSNNSSLRNRAACKTSPLHKVRKSVGGIPLSSHISKARKSIALPASTSKLTSVRQKSPQQVVSGRLVSRARKSLCATPISTRARNMVMAAKTPPSILRDTQLERKPIEQRKAVLFADKLPPEGGDMDDLSRTFIVDSDEEEEEDAAIKETEKDKPKDATFSPEKDKKIDETDKASTTINTTFSPEKKTDNKEDVSKALNEDKDDHIKAIEIPVDVEEITATKEEKMTEQDAAESNVANQRTNNENKDTNNDLTMENITESIELNNEKQCETAEERNDEIKEIINSTKDNENKDVNKEIPAIDNEDSLVTEESFAEIINEDAPADIEECVDAHNVKESIDEIIEEGPCDTSKIEDIEEIIDTHNLKESNDITEGPRESSQTESQESFGDVVNITEDELEEDQLAPNVEQQTKLNEETQAETKEDQLATNIEKQTKLAEEKTTESSNTTQDKERSDDDNQSLHKDKLETAEIGFGEESIVEILETVNPEDNSGEEENKRENNDHTKPETIVLTEADSVPENIETETESNDDIVQESKIAEHLASEEKTIDEVQVLDDSEINIIEPKDNKAENIETESNVCNDEQTKPETIVLTEEDNVTEIIETKTETESKITEQLASEEKTIDEVHVLDDFVIDVNEQEDVAENIETESKITEKFASEEKAIDEVQVLDDSVIDINEQKDKVAENIETKTETESKITEKIASEEKTIDEVQVLDDSVNDINEQEDNVAENIETKPKTESNVGDIVQETKITEHSAREEKTVDETQILDDSEININEQKNELVEENIDEEKTEVYKPIYEDITLEGSLIEKETKELEEHKTIKQPQYEDITLEGSLIEEMEKSETNLHEIQEQSEEKICLETTKDTEDVKQLNVEIKEQSEDKIDQETAKDSEEPKEETLVKLETETVGEDEETQLTPKVYLEEPQTETASVKVNELAKDQETPIDSDNVEESKEETIEKLETETVGEEEAIEIKEHSEDEISQETPKDSDEPKDETLEKLHTETVEEEEQEIQLILSCSLEEPEPETVSVKVNELAEAETDNLTETSNVVQMENNKTPKDLLTANNKIEEHDLSVQEDSNEDNSPPKDSQIVDRFELKGTHEETENKMAEENVLQEPDALEQLDLNRSEIETDENTSKLLEEIEDVLNKSDEIKQKHLDEMQSIESETPLTEEFECEETNLSDTEQNEQKTTLDKSSKESKNIESEDQHEEIVAKNTSTKNEQEKVDESSIVSKSPEKSKHVTDCHENITTEIENPETVSKAEAQSEEIVAEIKLQSPDIVPKSENESLKMLAVKVKPETTKTNIEDIPSVSSIKKKIEKTTTLTPRRTRRSSLTTEATSSQAAELTHTPRRSTRRTSLSAEISTTSQTVEAAILTPRRSTRRASMSTESTNTGTPTKISTRRASLSIANETPLTPKRISSRRSSTTIDDNPLQPVLETKTPRAKTPLKQLEQRIVEEKTEDMEAIIEEEEVEPTVEKVTCNKEIVSKQVLQDVAKETDTLESNENENTNEIIAKEVSDEKNVAEESKNEIVSNEVLKLNIKDVTDEIDILESKANENTDKVIADDVPKTEETNVDEETVVLKTETDEISKITNKEDLPNAAVIDEVVSVETAFIEDTKPVDENLKQLEVDETLLHEDNTIITTNEGKEIISKVAETNEISDADKAIEEIESISDNVVATTNDSEEIAESVVISDDKEIESISDNVITTNDSKEIVAIVDERIAILDDQSAEEYNNEIVESKEIATPKKLKKSVKIVADSPKTPVMTGMRELLKTPKAELNTPKYVGIRDLVRTPKVNSEHHEEEETEKLAVLADLVKTPKAETSKEFEEVSTPKTKKSTELLTNTPKTPVMIGMRDLLKTPKTELNTPKLAGIRDLVKTPKLKVANEEEEVEKLAVLAQLVKTPKTESVSEESEPEEIATTSTKVTTISTPKTKKTVKLMADSPKTPIMTGMRELLKTPNADKTPKFAGIRNLVQTPKQTSENELEECEKLAGVADLVKTPQAKVAGNIVVERLEEIPTTSAKDAYLRGVKELMKTPKSCSTPRFKGMRELMQTPKMCSTPLMGGIKELMNSPARKDNENMDKFLKTPTAKNIMIPSLPSSAVIEKSTDSIEVSTEYDLNATNEGEMANLEELFKTPVASRFVERITASYYGEEGEDHDEAATIFNQTEEETLQEKLNKSAEDAFDELTGQESQIQTPIRKTYPRKSLGLQTPQAQSPFTTADVLSDLPKTDVEEWIETLDQAETPIVVEDDDEANVVAVEETASVGEEVLDDEISYLEDSFVEQNKSLTNDESIIPETCAKVYLKEKCVANVTSSSEVMLNLSSIKKTNSKDPLAKTTTKLLTKVARPVTPMDAEISGIDLLDQTLESVQDEQLSILEEPLVVEETSIFEEHLVLSDNDSEADVTLNDAKEVEEEQHSLANETLGACDDEDEYDMLEPLLVSDSEDLDQSLELKENVKTTQELLEKENNSQEGNETTSLYTKNDDKSSTNDPLDSELVISQEQLFDVIDLETSEIEDDSSKESNEEDKSVNQKPESINDSKDVENEDPAEETVEEETEIIENFVIEDDVIEKDEEIEIIENSVIEDDVIEMEEETEIIENFVIEDDVIEKEEETEVVENSVIEDDVKDKEGPVEEDIEIVENSLILEDDVSSTIREIPLMEKDSSKQDSKNVDVSLIEEDLNEDSENNTKSVTDTEPIIDSKDIDNSLLEDSIIEDSFTESKRDDNSKAEIIVPLQQTTSKSEKVENTEELSTETVQNIEVNTTEHASHELEASKNHCALPKEITTDSESEVVNTTTEELYSTEASEKEDIENVEEILTTAETLEQSEILEKEIENDEFNSAEASEKEDIENVEEILTDETLEQSEILEEEIENEKLNSAEASEKEDNVEQILTTYETLGQSEILQKEIEMEQKLEVSIKELRKSDDLFMDDSMNVISNEDIVETVETSSSNKTEIIKASPKETNTEFDQESEDIFMDTSINENSKVDDSFADKATNDEKDVENESAMVEVTTKEMANTDSDTELTLSEDDVAIVDQKVCKEVLSGEDVKVEDNSKVVSNEEVQEFAVKNDEQLEENLTAPEISDDENLTASENVTDQLSEESNVDKASLVNEISESIEEEEIKTEQDLPTNTTCEVIDEKSENIKEADVENSITETVSEDISKNITKSDDKVSNEILEPAECTSTQNVSECKENINEFREELQELNKTDKEPFDTSSTAELSKEPSEDINDILESGNKLEETNDDLKDLDKETTKVIKPYEKKPDTTPESSIGDIKTPLDKLEQDLTPSQESKTELIPKSIDQEISKTTYKDSQQTDIPKTVKQKSEQDIITLDDATDKDPQNSEKVKTSIKDISFEEKNNKLVEESTEVDVAKTSCIQTADKNIEIIQTYDFKVKITDTESKSDNSELQTETLRKGHDSNATAQTVKESIENSTKSSEFPEVSVHKEAVLEKGEDNKVQSNVAIAKLIEDKKCLLEVKESVKKEAEITVKETTTCVANDTKETVRPQRRKRTASDSSQGSVHEDDNKSTVRRGRRKVQKTPAEETLVEEIKENEDHPAISTTAAVPKPIETLVEQEEKNNELSAFSNHKDETLTEQVQEQEQDTKHSSVLIPEDAKPKLTTDVLKAIDAEDAEKEQALDILEDIKAEAVEKSKEQVVVKRGRRKPTVSESSQGSVNDDECTTRRARRKLQKTQIEQTLLEENEELPNVSTPVEKIEEETLGEHKEEDQKDELPEVSTQEVETNEIVAEEEIPEVPKDNKDPAERQEEKKEHTVKRGRRKQTVSESSQGSVNGDETTHSQRARRKVQKTRVEEPLVEEELPTTSTVNIAEKYEKPSTVLSPKDEIVIESTEAKEIPALIVKVTESLIEENELPTTSNANIAEKEEKLSTISPANDELVIKSTETMEIEENQENEKLPNVTTPADKIKEVHSPGVTLVEHKEKTQIVEIPEEIVLQNVKAEEPLPEVPKETKVKSEKQKERKEPVVKRGRRKDEELPTTSTANIAEEEDKPSVASPAKDDLVSESTGAKEIPVLNEKESLIEEKQELSSVTHSDENKDLTNVSTSLEEINELDSAKELIVKLKEEIQKVELPVVLTPKDPILLPNAEAEEQLPEVPKETKIQTEGLEERKEPALKRVRRKQTVSESSQGSVNGDDATHSQRARRKVQKTRAEEPLVETDLETTSTAEIVEKEEKFSTVSSPKDELIVESENPVLDVEVTESLIEEQQDVSSDLPQKEVKEEATKVQQETRVPPKAIEDAIKQTVKHGRRKQTVSESSQDSTHDEVTSTRRGRRKVLKTPVDKPLIKEKPVSTIRLEELVEQTENVPKATNQPSEVSPEVSGLDEKPTESSHDSNHAEESKRNSPHNEQITLAEENIIEQVNVDETTTAEVKEIAVAVEKVQEIESITVNETEVIEIEESKSNKLNEPHSSQVDKTKSSVDETKLPSEEEISAEHEQQVEGDAAGVGEQQEVTDVAAKRATKRGGRKVAVPESADVELPKSRSRIRNRKSPTSQPTVNELPNIDKIGKEEVVASESHKSEAIIDEIVISDDEIIETKPHKVQDDHTEKDPKLKLKTTKTRGKRTRTASDSSQGSVADEEPTKRRARPHKQIPNIDEAILEESQTAENPNTDNFNELPEKTSAKETANENKDDKLVEHQTLSIDSREDIPNKPKTSGEEATKIETIQTVDETKNIELTEVQITEVNLEPENQHSSPEVKEKTIRGRRGGRHHVVAEEEHQEIKPGSKRKAAVAKNMADDHQESGPVSKRRVGRRKQDHEQEEHAHAIHVTADDCKPHEDTTAEKIVHEEPKKGRGRRKKEEHPAEAEHHKTSEDEKVELDVPAEECTHTETASTSSKRRVGRRKLDPEQEEHDDDIKPNEEKSNESSLAPEEPKKGRGRGYGKKKDEHPEEPEPTTTSHSPQAKPRGRKRKESQTDNPEQSELNSRKPKESHTDTEDHHHEQKDDQTQQAEAKIKLLTAEAAPHTPQRATAVPRRGRKASAIDVDRHAHIVAAEGAEDTPSKRPLRKAATVYHNYDETSNDAVMPTKAKKKTDSPRKSLEAAKTSPSATVTTALITEPSPTASSTPAATTARGRTRKPTARVQQFLEEERAKAETPKKRGLLAAVTTDLTDTPTPQRMPGRRGRKPSTIDVDVDTVGTPQATKRGRGKAITHTEELEKETAKVIEEKETEPTTPPAATVAAAAKGRRGGRKAKITAEDQHHDEDEQPPAKKSPQVLEAEKQETSPELDGPTPTRTAGRRGAATAAKARIEEDALAAAAIDPPKRARAKKVPTAKIVAAAIASAATDTEGHSSEMDEEQQNKSKSLKAEDVTSGEDKESDIVEKPVNKRGARKVAATTSATDSPAVPPKRGRKAKTVSEATDTETVGEVKATRGAGRGRKNVHFDEIQAAEKVAETLEHLSSTTEQTSEESAAPAKRGTRTRRK